MHQTLVVIFTLLMTLSLPVVFFSGVLGAIYVFVIAGIFFLADHTVGITTPLIFASLFLIILTFFVDILSGVLGAHWGGANKVSVLSGTIGLILGTFFIPIPFLGSLVGIFAGILISELIQRKKGINAVKAATGGVIGTVVGGTMNALFTLFYIVYFVLLVWHP